MGRGSKNLYDGGLIYMSTHKNNISNFTISKEKGDRYEEVGNFLLWL